MQAKPTLGRAKRHQLVIAIIVLAALLLPAIPARALIGVTATDSEHPSVGAIWWIVADCDDDRVNEEYPSSCIPPEDVPASGILIAPNVVLTNAGNALFNGRRVGISFESPVTDFGDYYDPVDNRDGSVHPGYFLRNPEWGGWRDFPGSYSHENNFDMAVVILDNEVPDVEPVSLADLGALDALKDTKKPLTAVGYGTTNFRGGNQEWTWDWARRAAAWEISGLKKSFVHTTAPGQHGPCDGDQGGPILAGDAVAAIMVNWDGICGAKGVGLGYRVDTQDAYEFLCNVGTEGWADGQNVENPNAPVIPGEFVDYPSVAPSAATLAAYCDDGDSARQAATASGDDGEQQRADRPHHDKGKHKNGGKHRGKGKRRG